MNDPKYIDEERISFRDFIEKVRGLIYYLLLYWKKMVLGTLIIASLRISYEVFRDTIYTAETTFIIEVGEGNMSQLGSLASVVGINLNSISDDSQLFDTDHIIELYRSYKMLKLAFLSRLNNENSERLITRYAKGKKLLKRWHRDAELENFSFEIPVADMGVKHDSLLMEVIDNFKKEQLIIAKPIRKLMILSIKVEDDDALFAEKFNTILVGIVNNFYERTSTKKTGENLRILQSQADSTRIILDRSLDQLAKISELQPNPNPLYYTNQVPFQKLQIDIEAAAAVYEEIVKNLEMAKITHRNKKPLIQIIDEPIRPLSIDKDKPLKLIAISSLIGGLFMLLFFTFKYVWKKLMLTPR
ncbi:MAG: exopolysaccharide biosynthesis protein [Cyclobacteriaceae bacterium]|nr:exopolysaccharide biosynthesis protein [Cyclobacteriaceae bacterium]